MSLKMHSYFQAFAPLGCECLQLVKLHPSSLQTVIPCETMSRFRWFISLLSLRFQIFFKVEQNQKSTWPLARTWSDITASWGWSCLHKPSCNRSQPTHPAEQTLSLFHFIKAYQHYSFQDQPANCIICVVFIGWRFLEFSLTAFLNEDSFKTSVHVFQTECVFYCMPCPHLKPRQLNQNLKS